MTESTTFSSMSLQASTTWSTPSMLDVENRIRWQIQQDSATESLAGKPNRKHHCLRVSMPMRHCCPAAACRGGGLRLRLAAKGDSDRVASRPSYHGSSLHKYKTYSHTKKTKKYSRSKRRDTRMSLKGTGTKIWVVYIIHKQPASVHSHCPRSSSAVSSALNPSYSQ